MAELKSLTEIFNNTLFRIPDYQRGYAWSENQILDFWNDLVNLVDKHNHYTGMLSLKEIDNEHDASWNKKDDWIIDEGYKAYYVIDGQQRLTTSIILIFSLISFCKKHDIAKLGITKISDIENKFISVSPEGSKYSKLYLFSYTKDDPSKNYLIYEIFENDNKPTLNETFYTLNLKHAKESFEEKIKNLYEKNGSKPETLDLLYKKLVNRFKFNIFNIENDFDVSVAFETMNNRGKKLSTLEILKNRLIYLTTIFSNDDLSEKDKDALRDEINTAWAEIYTQIGRNKNAPLNDDDFLRNHWNMYYQYYKTKGINYITDLLNRRFTVNRYFGNDVISYEIFSDPLTEVAVEEPEEYIEEVDEDVLEEDTVDKKLTADMIEKYVKSLMNSAKYYYYVYNPEDAGKDLKLPDDEVVWLKRIKRLGFVSFMPMLMAVLINKDKIEDKLRKRILSDIENMIFVVFRCCGYLSTYRANAFYTAARKLYNSANASECIDFLEEELRSVKSNFNQYFKGKITKLISDGGGFFKWNELRYFLFEYEQYLSSTNNSPTSIIEESYFKSKDKNDDSVSIEHILPQTIYEDCGYWINQCRGYNEKEINVLTNSLGNLLPLSQSINSSMQNSPFRVKKTGEGRQNRGYENGSLSEREVAKLDDWGPQSILNRGIDLLTFFEKRWNVKFYDRKENDSDESYNTNRKKAMTELLNLSFLNDKRDIPDLVEEIDIESIDVFSSDGNKIRLTDVSTNYSANLFYSKIQNGLIDKGIAFKAVRPRTGYIGLRKQFEDGKFSLFANVWFNKDYLRIDMNRPTSGGIGEYKGENYSLNFKYAVKVDSEDKIDAVVDELIESYGVDGEIEIGLEKVIDYIKSKLLSEKEKGNEYCEISAGDIQYGLNLKRAAGLICEAIDKVIIEGDEIIYKPSKKALSYKIKFDLRNRQ